MSFPSRRGRGCQHCAVCLSRSSAADLLLELLRPLFDVLQGVALVNDSQPVEREELIDIVDAGALGSDDARETPGGDDARLRAVFLLHARDDAVDQADVAVKHAGLDRLDRSLADDLLGLDDFDPRQLGGALKERLDGNLQAGRDGAADVFALFGDEIERGRRTEINRYAAVVVALVRADAVPDAVG